MAGGQESPDVDQAQLAALIDRARRGDATAFGELAERYRGYLLWLANREVDKNIQAKGGASDLVQLTTLQAHQAFSRFEGDTEEEVLAWLRRILLNNLSNFRRHYQSTDKRNINREQTLGGDSGSENLRRDPMFADSITPSRLVSGQEQEEQLIGLLQRLPEDYRQVIHLRYWEGFGFERIGEEMGRSPEAARKLWGRAVKCLQQELKESTGEPP